MDYFNPPLTFFVMFSKIFGKCKFIYFIFSLLLLFFLISGFFSLKNLFIYLFLAALGLHCCAQASSSCGELGLLFVAVCWLLIVVASLCCGAQALGTRAAVVVACRLSSCGTWA